MKSNDITIMCMYDTIIICAFTRCKVISIIMPRAYYRIRIIHTHDCNIIRFDSIVNRDVKEKFTKILIIPYIRDGRYNELNFIR